MASRRLVRGLSGLALVLASCLPRAGTDVGNGFAVTLNMQAYDAPGGGVRSLGASTAPVASIDSMWTTTAQFRLVPGASCATAPADGMIDIRGPVVADLAGAGFLGGPARIPEQAQTFCGLRLRFATLDALSLPAGAPPELAGLSLLVHGHRADGVPFVVRSTMTGDLKMDADHTSFTLPSGMPSLILGLEMSDAIGALGLDSLSGDPIVIDAASNPDRLQAFEQSIKSSAGLFEDLDADGKLQPSEVGPNVELCHGQ